MVESISVVGQRKLKATPNPQRVFFNLQNMSKTLPTFRKTIDTNFKSVHFYKRLVDVVRSELETSQEDMLELNELQDHLMILCGYLEILKKQQTSLPGYEKKELKKRIRAVYRQLLNK